MAGYVRNDTLNNIANGNVINAADLDGEFDAIVQAFHASTGHVHDGTAANGAPITKLGPSQEFVASSSALSPKTDNTYDLGSATFEFKDAYIDGTAYVDAIDLNGTAITATGTEINYLSGVTSAIQTQLGNKQPLDSELTAIAGLTSAADKVPYFTGSGTAAVADFTSFGRSLVDDANSSAARTTLGLVIGTDVQAYDPQLADVAGLTPTDGNFIVGDGTNFVTESGSTARTSLGLGTIATQDASNVTITGGSVTGITDLAVADGGTGASTAANARVNLLPSYTGNGGKVLAVNVGATDTEWITVATGGGGTGDVVGPASSTDNTVVRFDGTTGKIIQTSGVTINDSNEITTGVWKGTEVGVAYGGTGASTLTGIIKGNGTSAFTAATAGTDYLAPAAIGTTVQAYDAELAALAGVTSAADKVPYFTGSGTAAVTDFTSFGRSLVDDANATAAQSTLGLVIGTNVQAYDAQLADVAGLSVTDGNFIVGNGTNFVAESGATARTSLGLGTGDSPEFTAVNVTTINARDGTASISLANTTGIATLSKATVIETADNTNAALRITQTGTGNALLVEDSANPDASPFVIDASGNVIVGTTASITNGVVATTPVFQEHGLTNSSSAIGLTNWSSTASRTPSVNFNRSAGNTVGTRGGITTAGTGIGAISFSGDDGTNWLEAARIESQLDATGGTNDMPGRLVFSTTADGASTPTERMRITNAGNVGIGTTPTARLTVLTTSTFDASNAIASAGINIQQSTGTAGIGNFSTGLTFSKIDSSRPFGAIVGVQTLSDVDQGGLAFFVHNGAGANDVVGEAMRLDASLNLLVGGTAARATTAGSAHLDLFNGTAPVGTLTNGISLYSSSGDFNFMDAAGNGYKVGFRNIPPVGTKTGSYTLATSDVGEYVQVGSGGSITIPNSTFAEGDVVSIFNNTSGNITITCTITTAYIAGTDSDKASVTLATRGIASVLFISGTVCVITGNVS
jgi:hypothetical protein